ncbi:MAG TPA: ABC transporter permease [Desulfurococcaceae archaeon]|nr:ABC transporter permease [Desulfurococcaceae archaeon]
MLGSNIFYIMMIIGVTSWPTTARIVRAQVLSIKEQQFVESVRAVGASASYMLFKHILPHAIAPALAYTILLISRAMLIEAGLSYIGLGDPNLPSWGRMIYEGQPYVFSAWWMSFFPGLFLSITVLGWNFLGDALNRYFNPKLREKLF